MNKVEWVFYYCKDRNEEKIVTSVASFKNPNRSNNYKEVKKIFGQNGVTSYGYIRKDKFDQEKEIFSRPNFQEIIAEAKKTIRSLYGDIGACVLGMRLIYKSVPIAEQIVQGDTTNYHYFEEVKKQLIEKLGYAPDGFVTEHGHID